MGIPATSKGFVSCSCKYSIEIMTANQEMLKELPATFYVDLDKAVDEAIRQARRVVCRTKDRVLVSVWSIRVNGVFSGDYHFWMSKHGKVSPASSEDAMLPDQR